MDSLISLLSNVNLDKSGPDGLLVDSSDGLAVFVDSLKLLPRSSRKPVVFLDLEGEQLSRLGSIALIQIHVPSTKKTYLIDVSTLGKAAFSTSAKSKPDYTLKTFLEDADILKGIFDVRADNDALFNLYGITLAGVNDIQLIELATRGGRKRFLNGLARAIRNDARLGYAELRQWEAIKELGRKCFAPELGGSFTEFSKRPMNAELV